MKLIKLSAIGSTNSYLKELVANTQLEDEVIVVAKEQIAGRGQHGASWQSQPNKSLTCSLFRRFQDVSIEQQTLLNFTVSLALLNVLKEFNIPDVSIKWPNDIMSRQKKLAGILIENQIKGSQIASTIIGIGLNVNETEFSELPQATSMYLSSGTSFAIENVLNEVALAIFRALHELAAKSFTEVQQLYESHLFRRDKVSVFEIDGVQKNGQILGVTPEGTLRVMHEDDVIQAYGLKEITLLY